MCCRGLEVDACGRDGPVLEWPTDVRRWRSLQVVAVLLLLLLWVCKRSDAVLSSQEGEWMGSCPCDIAGLGSAKEEEGRVPCER